MSNDIPKHSFLLKNRGMHDDHGASLRTDEIGRRNRRKSCTPIQGAERDEDLRSWIKAAVVLAVLLVAGFWFLRLVGLVA